MRPKKIRTAITYKRLPRIVAECLIANLGLFFVGYQLSTFDDIKPALAKELNIANVQSDILFFNLLFMGGGVLGALVAGCTAPSIGRKKTMVFADLVGILGIGMTLVLQQEASFAIGRFLTGLAAGINTVVVHLFTFEMLPREVFHRYAPMNQISFTFGFVISRLGATLAFLGFVKETFIEEHAQLWRLLAAIPLLTSLLRCMLYIFCWERDTAKYYTFKNMDHEASSVLNSYYKQEWIIAKTRELVSIRNDQSEPDKKPVFANMFKKKYLYRTIVCLGLGFFKQTTLVNAFLCSKEDAISDKAYIGDRSNIVVVCWTLGAAVGSIATAFVLGFRGKKKILLMGGAILIVMASVAVLCDFEEIYILPDVAELVYITAYSFSYGPITWMFYCYLLPDQGISIVQAVEWALGALLIWIIYLVNYGSFVSVRGDLQVLFIMLNTFGFFFLMQFVREIKGKDYFTIKRKFESEDEDEMVKEIFLQNRPTIFD